MLKYLWSKLFLKMHGVAIKKSSTGRNSRIGSGSLFVYSTMGNHSYCGNFCMINQCDIGSFCSIANNVVIGGGNHPIEWVSTSSAFYNNKDSVKKKFSRFERKQHPRVTIGNDVWIGERAIIKAGIKIGTGAVIGMGSVVVKDISPYAVVGGNPANLIKMRFDEKTISELLMTKWWEWSEEKLTKMAQYIKDPTNFIRYTQL